jgi:hypothetical protein
MIKFLIFSFAATLTLASLVGCADSTRQSSTTESSSSMTVDSKDISHTNGRH